MGFFGKKHTDPPKASGDEPEVVVIAPPALPPPPASPERRPPPTTRYTVDNAIQLMRKLPVDQNPELVVLVIKQTLESMHVRLNDVIEDAARKQQGLRDRMGELQSQIDQLEREARARRDEIAKLDADLAETTAVRDRLVLAEGKGGAAEAREAHVTAMPSRRPRPPLPSVPPIANPPPPPRLPREADPSPAPISVEPDLLSALPDPPKP